MKFTFRQEQKKLLGIIFYHHALAINSDYKLLTNEIADKVLLSWINRSRLPEYSNLFKERINNVEDCLLEPEAQCAIGLDFLDPRLVYLHHSDDLTLNLKILLNLFRGDFNHLFVKLLGSEPNNLRDFHPVIVED